MNMHPIHIFKSKQMGKFIDIAKYVSSILQARKKNSFSNNCEHS